MNEQNPLAHVPPSLRAPIEGLTSDHLASILAPLLAAHGADFDKSIQYVAGAIDHQRRIRDESSKVFKATIVAVNTVNRKTAKGFNLGDKCEIIFSASTKGGGIEEQSIMSGWVVYNSNNPEEFGPWQVALARTVVTIARANIGKEVFLRKAFFQANTAKGGDRVRYLADIMVPYGSGSSGNGNNQGSTAAPQRAAVQQAPQAPQQTHYSASDNYQDEAPPADYPEPQRPAARSRAGSERPGQEAPISFTDAVDQLSFQGLRKNWADEDISYIIELLSSDPDFGQAAEKVIMTWSLDAGISNLIRQSCKELSGIPLYQSVLNELGKDSGPEEADE